MGLKQEGARSRRKGKLMPINGRRWSRRKKEAKKHKRNIRRSTEKKTH